MARPKNLERDLLIYLHVYFLRKKHRRSNGKTISLDRCYENVRKKLEVQWKSEEFVILESNGMPLGIGRRGANIGAQGEYGAIRAACASGRNIAMEIAARYDLPASLSDEQRVAEVERCLLSSLPTPLLGAFITALLPFHHLGNLTLEDLAKHVARRA